ncbi:hypothetical protein J40TS1_40180 [Paenibacillus montaniterrae]|uniref:Uncharacterized protein n=1 Tax=Paenibacillus montaniterrae TaxID=429341 RepID=A0A919YTW7_9BACL|nr:hypothetical protein [Paenibacillus montaniterrae]GIP18376.1 hypothetical protein J40TS1_40180 [Paenibacillus montaniterrae]
MITRYTVDMLNESGVSVKTQKVIEVDGVEHLLGEPHRKAYLNSVAGRAEVQAELPIAQQNAIFAVWGDSPTITEQSPEQNTEDDETATE